MQESEQLFSPIKARILQFVDYQGISKYKFYKETGITRGVLDKKSGISEENQAKFIARYPSVNVVWLVTGSGEMIQPEVSPSDAPEIIEILKKELEEKKKYIAGLEDTVKDLIHILTKQGGEELRSDTRKLLTDNNESSHPEKIQDDRMNAARRNHQ